MDSILKQIADKISSYNLFTNLYPGIIYCYLLKVMFHVDILLDNWFENLIIFYFVGMVLSRVGSVLIEPIIKSISFKNKPLVKHTSYSDYVHACAEDSIISTLSETNNTYRTMIACFLCAIMFKIGIAINDLLMTIGCGLFQNNADWLLLVFLLVLFVCSYIKQTNYVKKRVEVVIQRSHSDK